MEKIDIVKATEYTSPNPVTVICTTKPDGTPNLAPVSWFTYLSFNPPTVAFAMGHGSYTGEVFRGSGKAIVTVPAAGIEEQVVQCGLCSGRDSDKSGYMELAGIEGFGIKIPAKSKLAICVKLRQFLEAGDHYLYICDAGDVYYDPEAEALFAWNGYARLAPARPS